MTQRAGEALRPAAAEDHVQHRVLERRIRAVAVRFPIGRAQVELDRPLAEFSGDLNCRLQEIRPRAAVPLAELYDAHRISRGIAEVPAEGPGEPQGLEFQLRRQRDWRSLGHSKWLPHGEEQSGVVHGHWAGGGGGGSRMFSQAAAAAASGISK